MYSYIQTSDIHALTTKTNIILIGVDSLPPNSINTQNTPIIDRFIKQSVQFKETISPLARTYPAWTSILTGLYPYHHGARYNLMRSDQVKSSQSIAWKLQTLGYETIFATDDRRFNIIDKEFGFQHIIGPKLGVNDILLGTFNDFPLSNLLVNFSISHWLFPYNHMNRASYFTYYPQTFDLELNKFLSSRDKNLPMFFAVHFTLPHWPYAFASSIAKNVGDEYSVNQRGELFTTAIQHVDKQVAQLLQNLKQSGHLQNSLVILLSDHGESLYVPGSRQTQAFNYQGHGIDLLSKYFKEKTSTVLDKSAGHGSDLLSKDQYHCVFASQIYKNGKRINSSKTINTRVSLIDIAPTIKEFLNLSSNDKMDGISLLNSMRNKTNTLPERAFIMESGMLPNQFLSREKARLLGAKLFSTNSSGLLYLRKSAIKQLDATKLHAIIDGDWVFALYPNANAYIPIIQQISNGKWTDNMADEFAKHSPYKAMLKKLHLCYHKNWNINPQTDHKKHSH